MNTYELYHLFEHFFHELGATNSFIEGSLANIFRYFNCFFFVTTVIKIVKDILNPLKDERLVVADCISVPDLCQKIKQAINPIVCILKLVIEGIELLWGEVGEHFFWLFGQNLRSAFLNVVFDVLLPDLVTNALALYLKLTHLLYESNNNIQAFIILYCGF